FSSTNGQPSRSLTLSSILLTLIPYTTLFRSDRAPELPQALQDGVLEVRIVHGQVRQIPFEAMPQRPPERARAARGLGRQQAGIEQQADLAAAGAARRPPSGAPWPACRCRGSPR